MIKPFVKRYWRTIIVAVFILIVTMRSVPPRICELALFSLPYFDKAIHASMFALLALSIGKDVVMQNNIQQSGRILIWIVLLPTAYGGLIELMQEHLTTNRSGDMFDLLNDFGGCVIIYLIYKLRHQSQTKTL